jgi:hypothetical protein
VTVDDTYEVALKRSKRQGIGQCDDAAAMAGWCERLPQLLGVAFYNPQRIWEKAREQRWTFGDLMKLSHTDPWKVQELQHVER